MRQYTNPGVSGRSPRHRAPIVAGVAVLAALAGPASLRAQGMDLATDVGPAASRTHVVKKGDTLWDLARAYMGDPFQWPEIYRMNERIVEDPHWIYPGESLRMPGAAAPVEPAGEESVGDGAPPDETATTDTDTLTEDETPGADSGMMALGPVRHTAMRVGEYRAAPWVERQGEPRGAGHIVASADVPGITAASVRKRFQPHDRVFVTPPTGATPAAGDQYLAFKLGPRLNGLGQVVIPTGILLVERPGTGEATRVRIVQQFEEVSLGDGLIPLDTTVRPSDARPAPVEGGATATVVWLKDKPVLASIQQYAVLDAAAKAGLRPGDRVTLFQPRQEVQRGVRLPEVPIATAEVVRVTPGAATVIVIDQQQPAIRTGTRARVTAKMP
jgi:hypothetical protein